MLTPKRLAAALRDSPPKTTASTTRLRRSSESAIPAASFPRQESSIRIHPIRESPSRFSPFGYRSNRDRVCQEEAIRLALDLCQQPTQMSKLRIAQVAPLYESVPRNSTAAPS